MLRTNDYSSKAKNRMKKNVAILSAGLGNVSRGFETSASLWYQALAREKELAVELFAGGPQPQATRIWNLPRNGKVARFLRSLRLIQDGCRLEQLSFGLGLLPYLFRGKLDVVWLQEATLASLMLRFKKMFHFRYRIMFCDGAPVGHAFAQQFDYLIFLHAYALQAALADGIAARRCAVIPHVADVTVYPTSKADARAHFGLASDRFVIICVAAWNKHHKRIDYLLQEVAQLQRPEITLLLCGQPEQETQELQAMAQDLGLDVQWHTLTRQDLSLAYSAADVFVLPSLHEGLAAVLLEAAAHQLPVLSHAHEGGKYVFGEAYEGLADFSQGGVLADRLKAWQAAADLSPIGAYTYRCVSERFNATTLTHTLVNFINRATL